MSEIIKRALRRQRAIQESRGTAWALFFAMLPIAIAASISLLDAARTGTIFSLGGIVGGVVAVSALWVAIHLFREALRLGKLLKDPELIVRLEQDPDVVRGIQWSVLNPFGNWRD